MHWRHVQWSGTCSCYHALKSNHYIDYQTESYILKASTVKCRLIPLINSLNKQSIDISVDSRLIFHRCVQVSRHSPNHLSTVDQVSIECQSNVDRVMIVMMIKYPLRCWSRVLIPLHMPLVHMMHHHKLMNHIKNTNM